MIGRTNVHRRIIVGTGLPINECGYCIICYSATNDTGRNNISSLASSSIIVEGSEDYRIIWYNVDIDSKIFIIVGRDIRSIKYTDVSDVNIGIELDGMKSIIDIGSIESSEPARNSSRVTEFSMNKCISFRDISHLLHGCSNLEYLYLDAEYITEMSSFIYGCSNLADCRIQKMRVGYNFEYSNIKKLSKESIIYILDNILTPFNETNVNLNFNNTAGIGSINEEDQLIINAKTLGWNIIGFRGLMFAGDFINSFINGLKNNINTKGAIFVGDFVEV